MSAKKTLGRPRKYKTQREVVAANKAYQRKASIKRAERYKKDREFRLKEQERSRKNYAEISKFKEKSFGKFAGLANKFASPKWVTVGGSLAEHAVLSIPRMARVLNVKSKALNEWIAQGKFPAPTHQSSKKGGLSYYTVDEANSFANILKAGLKGRGAFCKTDTDVIHKLHNPKK